MTGLAAVTSRIRVGTLVTIIGYRPQASVIPKGVTWILDRAKTIDPVARTVESEASGR